MNQLEELESMIEFIADKMVSYRLKHDIIYADTKINIGELLKTSLKSKLDEEALVPGVYHIQDIDEFCKSLVVYSDEEYQKQTQKQFKGLFFEFEQRLTKLMDTIRDILNDERFEICKQYVEREEKLGNLVTFQVEDQMETEVLDMIKHHVWKLVDDYKAGKITKEQVIELSNII